MSNFLEVDNELIKYLVFIAALVATIYFICRKPKDNIKRIRGLPKSKTPVKVPPEPDIVTLGNMKDDVRRRHFHLEGEERLIVHVGNINYEFNSADLERWFNLEKIQMIRENQKAIPLKTFEKEKS